MWNPPDAASIADQKIDAYEAMDKCDKCDCKETADAFVKSLIVAGEQAWLGWLLYVLEVLDPMSTAEDAERNPYFLVELWNTMDNRFCDGVWR